MVIIKRWQSKVKGAFRWSIRLWNYFPEILKFKPHVVTLLSQNWVKETRFVYHVRLAVNLVHSKKEFFDWKTSESWNIDPCCEHSRWSILLIYSRANIALSNVTLLLSFSVLEFSKFASISPVACEEGCVKRISDKWWSGGVGSENSQFCGVFFLEWSFMWWPIWAISNIYLKTSFRWHPWDVSKIFREDAIYKTLQIFKNTSRKFSCDIGRFVKISGNVSYEQRIAINQVSHGGLMFTCGVYLGRPTNYLIFLTSQQS